MYKLLVAVDNFQRLWIDLNKLWMKQRFYPQDMKSYRVERQRFSSFIPTIHDTITTTTVLYNNNRSKENEVCLSKKFDT